METNKYKTINISLHNNPRSMIEINWFNTLCLFPNWRYPRKDWDILRLRDKNFIAGWTKDYTKKRLSEVRHGLEKALAQVYYILGGILWMGKYRYWINTHFFEKNKNSSYFLNRFCIWNNNIASCAMWLWSTIA